MAKKPKKPESDYLQNEVESLRSMLGRLLKGSQDKSTEKNAHEQKQEKDTSTDKEKDRHRAVGYSYGRFALYRYNFLNLSPI